MASGKSNSLEYKKNPSIKSCFPETKSTESSDSKSEIKIGQAAFDCSGCVRKETNPHSPVAVGSSSPPPLVLYNNALFNKNIPLPSKSGYSNTQFSSFRGKNLSVLTPRRKVSMDSVESFSTQYPQPLSPTYMWANPMQKQTYSPTSTITQEAVSPAGKNMDGGIDAGMAGKMKQSGQTRHVPLYLAALKGDWETAKVYLRFNPHAVRATITLGSETVLHIAAGARHTVFVKKLVKRMTEDDLALQNKAGNTALCFAAVSGITDIAQVLVNKNKSLPLVRGGKGVTPLYMAVLLGRREMAWYLYSVTNYTDLSGEDRIGLLVAAITSNLFDVALELIKNHPELALARDGNGETALHVLSRKPTAFYSGAQLGLWQRCIYSCIQVKLHSGSLMEDENCVQRIIQGFWKTIGYFAPQIGHIYNIKQRHIEALELVRELWQQVLHLDDASITELIRTPKRLLFTAAEFGILEFITILIRSHPDLIWKVDEHSRSIFHTAVVHRQEKVFNLIYELGALKDFIAIYKDENDNNMLHLAGKLPHPSRLNTDSGAALQLRRELLWFQEVEKIVQPLYTEMENSEGKTPNHLFTVEHRTLKREGEKWMKDTASSCMVVATLIATVMFAAAFTVPGGNNQDTGRPIFLETRLFVVFVISDAVALISSASSVLIFLAILTSRYAEEDFLRSLPNKLIMGLATLFVSITSMMIAYTATIFIILYHGLAWTTIPIVIIACLPVCLFVSLQFPLVADMVCHTYKSFRSSSRLLKPR